MTQARPSSAGWRSMFFSLLDPLKKLLLSWICMLLRCSNQGNQVWLMKIDASCCFYCYQGLLLLLLLLHDDHQKVYYYTRAFVLLCTLGDRQGRRRYMKKKLSSQPFLLTLCTASAIDHSFPWFLVDAAHHNYLLLLPEEEKLLSIRPFCSGEE